MWRLDSQHIKFNPKGIALITVLALLLLVSLIGIATLSLVQSHSGLTFHQIKRQKAYYASQAGLEYAMQKIRNGSAPAGAYCLNLNNGEFSNGSCSLTAGPNFVTVNITTENHTSAPCSASSPCTKLSAKAVF